MSVQVELFQQLWLNMFAKYCIFCTQNQKVALTNQEIMNIAPALLLIGSIILLVSRVEGHQSLHALSQVFVHSPSAWNLLLCPSSRMTWITISLSAVLIPSFCMTLLSIWQLLKLGGVREVQQNRTAWWTEMPCLECSVDSKTFASHSSLVSVWKMLPDSHISTLIQPSVMFPFMTPAVEWLSSMRLASQSALRRHAQLIDELEELVTSKFCHKTHRYQWAIAIGCYQDY